jgi:hypothetical protein
MKMGEDERDCIERLRQERDEARKVAADLVELIGDWCDEPAYVLEKIRLALSWAKEKP